MPELRGDQAGQRRRVGFIADVPRVWPGQFGVGCAGVENLEKLRQIDVPIPREAAVDGMVEQDSKQACQRNTPPLWKPASS